MYAIYFILLLSGDFFLLQKIPHSRTAIVFIILCKNQNKICRLTFIIYLCANITLEYFLMIKSNYKGRKINAELLKKLKIEHSPYNKILKYITIDSALRFEIGEDGKVDIYYRKCIALTLGARSCSVNKIYFTNGWPEEFDLKLKIAIENSRLFFQIMKREIDSFIISKNINKLQRSAIHKIAAFNQIKDDKYVVINVDYNVKKSYSNIIVNERSYDLVAINQATKGVILFDVIYGTNELFGENGLQSKIRAFQNDFRINPNKDLLAHLLAEDIANIVIYKNDLGILNYQLYDNFRLSSNHIEYKFIFVPDNTKDYNIQINEYNNAYIAEQIPAYYQTIIVDIDDIPKLK